MSKIFFLFLNFKFARLFFFADLGHGIIEQTTGSLYFWAAIWLDPGGAICIMMLCLARDHRNYFWNCRSG